MPHHLLDELAALVPPLVVAVVFCLVIFSLVRREMGPKRRKGRGERKDHR